MANDPYQTLGVARTASLNEIKAAYRKLAKSLHPDLNPGNKAAEKRFKEVASAYEILNDPVKKAKFDRGESEEFAQEGPQRRYYSQSQGPGFESSYRQGFSFEDIFGEAFAQAREEEKNIQVELPVSLTEAVLGGSVRVRTPSGDIILKIPAGVSSGSKLRIRGKGHSGHRGGTPGDVIAEVKIVMPSKIDDELKAKIREWSEKHPYDARTMQRGPHAA